MRRVQEKGLHWAVGERPAPSTQTHSIHTNSPSSPLGSASNTFVPYVADDSSGVLYFRLAPDATDPALCGMAAVAPRRGAPQLLPLTSCEQTDPAEQVV